MTTDRIILAPRQATAARTLQCPADDTKWAEVERVLKAYYYQPDLEAARALYSAVAAHDLKGQPVWPVVVAPPGSMKTQLVTALDGLPRVHVIATVTPKTFISGQIQARKSSRASSLLRRIGDSGIIVTPDFSTVLAMRTDDRGAILADMRCIFDGHLRKEFGTAEKADEWRGRITYVTAATPVIDKHSGVNQSLGDRFVLIRWHRVDGMEAAKAAMNQDPDAHSYLKKAVHTLLCDLIEGEPNVPDRLQNEIAALAEFAARGRMHVERDQAKRLVTISEAESPTRLAMQFCQLAKGSARIGRRGTVEPKDVDLVRRVAFDCIPARRRVVLNTLLEGRHVVVDSGTASYDREDLTIADLVDQRQLSDRAVELLTKGGIGLDESYLTTTPPGTNDQKINRAMGSSSEEKSI
jgi:hypothetical protein